MLLFSLAPFIAWLLIFLVVYSQPGQYGPFTRLRIALLIGSLLHQLCLLLITEILSAFSLLTFSAVLMAWLFMIILLVGYCRYRSIPFKLFKEITGNIRKSVTMNWMGMVVFVILLVSFLIGLIYPPNNYDSMTYHMARVVHWEQQHSLAYYPTHVIRQLVYQPFAEYIILHLQLLTGGDRLANSVQLFFFAGCISNVTLIAKELNANRQQQNMSAFFTALIPMAILQSNSTQNDIIVAFFVLAFVWLTVRLFRSFTIRAILLAGIAMGLACLTKGTAYIFLLPFAGWYLVRLVKDRASPFSQLAAKAGWYALIPLIALFINSTFLYRNYQLNGSVLGHANDDTGNKGFHPGYLVLVGVKNIFNHIPVNGIANKLFYTSAKIGIDAEDPRYNFGPTSWMMDRFFFHEDYMQNFVHTILILLLTITFFFKKRLLDQRLGIYRLYALTLLATSLLFCTLLKWQPWANRLETTLFMLYAVFLAFEMTSLRKWILAICYLAMIWFGAKALLQNVKRPILPLRDSIFVKGYDAAIYTETDLRLKHYLDSTHYEKIGIIIGLDGWDYPYYKLLKAHAGKERVLKHVLVSNESTKYDDGFIPDLIIGTDRSKERYTIGNRQYYRSVIFPDNTGIYLPSN